MTGSTLPNHFYLNAIHRIASAEWPSGLRRQFQSVAIAFHVLVVINILIPFTHRSITGYSLFVEGIAEFSFPVFTVHNFIIQPFHRRNLKIPTID
eukprot:scaffold633_cov288-Ochromonas_danica.AAC.29